jgi:hypothetical protein
MVNIEDWLHRWQELVGAIIGASAVTSTIWFTLKSERRKLDEEANALRIALGAEVRQFAVHALDLYREISELVSSPGYSHGIGGSWVKKMIRFSDPVIYPQCAAKIGVLGQHAFAVVHFYNQINLVHDVVDQLSDNQVADSPQMINVLGALLTAAEVAVGSLPGFANTPRSQHDPEFTESVRTERRFFDEKVAKYQPS